MLQKNAAFGEGNCLTESGAGTRSGRTWNVLAHLSVFVNLLTGFLGPVAALILRLTHGRRSSTVGRHAMRSFWNQVVWLLLVAPVGFLFTLSLFLLLPVPEASLSAVMVALALAWLAVPFAEGAWAAHRASRDEDYRYLLDRLTSVGGGGKVGSKRKTSHFGISDDLDEDLDAPEEGFAGEVDVPSAGDPGGSDFGGDWSW